MSLETDLAGEQEPEERMAKHEELSERVDTENEKSPDSDANGEMTTEDFDVEEALEAL